VRRRALAAGGIALVLAAVAWLVLREHKTQYVHRADPAFSVLYKAKVVHRVPGQLMTLTVRRGAMHGTVVARRYALPDYEGDVAGALPVLAERLIPPGRRITSDRRARLNTAPGYEIGFAWDGGEGKDLILVPPDVRHPREGVLLSYRLSRPPGRQPLRIRRAAQALRSALRSFEFGTDRF
jgi:hypothetical protein